MSFNVLPVLQALERELHEPKGRYSRERLVELLHPQFFELGRSGATYTLEEVIEQLLAKESLGQSHSQDFKATELAPKVVLLTYKSANVTSSGDLDRYTNRSSIWRLEAVGWQMLFHQGTPTEPFSRSAH